MRKPQAEGGPDIAMAESYPKPTRRRLLEEKKKTNARWLDGISHRHRAALQP